MLIETCTVQCPYCGESIEIVVDCSVSEQIYIEDCSVCCRPLTLTVGVTDDGIALAARREDEA